MLLLTELDVAGLLSMRDAIDAVESALRAQAADRIHQPLRVMAKTPVGIMGAMPGAIFSNGGALAAKLVSFFPGNAAKGLHTHTAVIALFDSATGAPKALIDGRYITEIRTGAVSAVATRVLAGAAPGVVAVIGTGVQARAHVDALRELGLVQELRVWGKTPAHVDALVAAEVAQGVRAIASASPSAACHGALIICTVTSARSAILHASDVEPGAHINAVGSCTPEMQELAPDLMGRTRIFVDTVEGAMREAGDIIIAIREGALPSQPQMTLLCDVVAGKSKGRQSGDEITLFKSLGMAIEDVACAALVVDRARERGIGMEFAL